MTLLTDEINAAVVQAWAKDRPRAKTEAFDRLLKELNGDTLMAEMMWLYWGKDALKYLDWEKPEFNQHLRWWKFKLSFKCIKWKNFLANTHFHVTQVMPRSRKQVVVWRQRGTTARQIPTESFALFLFFNF